MGTTPQSCSIVVRCRDEEKHIGRLLRSIGEQTISDVQIIVVDSGSRDATLDIAKRYPVDVCEIPPHQFSFGRALNVGCRMAIHEQIVIASAHVYPVSKTWLAELLGPLSSDPRIGAVYGRQRGNRVTRFSEHQVFAEMFPDGAAPDSAFCHNANAAIRKSLWCRIPYDEELPGLEDLAWAAEAARRGFRSAYAPEALVVHVHDETPLQIYRRYLREAIAQARLEPHQRRSAWATGKEMFSNIGADLLRAWRSRALLANARSILEYRVMQYLGIYRGFGRSSLDTTPRPSNSTPLSTSEPDPSMPACPAHRVTDTLGVATSE